MFFREETINELISKIKLTNTDGIYENLFQDFCDKKYTIIFHFNTPDDSIYYEAFKKSDVTLRTNIDYCYYKICFFLNKDYFLEDFIKKPESIILAYYVFLSDKERSLKDPNYIDRKYHFVPENLRHFNDFDPEHQAQLLEARNKFLELLTNLDKKDALDINNTFEDELAKVKVVKDFKLFDLIKEGTYEFKSEDLIHELPANIVSVRDKLLFDEIIALRGNKLVINGNDYKILPEIVEASVNIDEFNKVIFTPSFRFVKQKRFFYDGRKTFLEINVLRRIIRVLKFTNKTSAIFYKYFVENPIIKVDYIQDIMEAKLGDELVNIIQPKKTQDIESHFLYIDYNVNLRITNDLEFSTVFRLNHKNFTREELIKNYFYRKIVYKFESILEKLNLPENSLYSNIDVLDFLTMDLTELKKIANLNLDNSIKEKKIITLPNIGFKAIKNNNWFELDIVSESYSDEQINKIFESLREKKNYVVINDDVIDLNHLENKKDLLDVYAFKSRYQKEFPMYELFRLEALKKHTSIQITYDDYVKNVLYEIKNYKDVEVKLPVQILSKLRPYQLEAVKWMSVLSRNGLSGILADDMGLGKTLETISYLETLKDQRPALIVCPKSVTYNWLYEFEKWNSTYDCIVIEGSKEYRDTIISSISSGKRAYIISYDTLRNDIETFENVDFNIVVLDESQYIKNADALKTKAVKRLKSKYKFALTGTPIENGLSDLWSIFDFIMPGYLSDYSSFKEEYELAFDAENGNQETRNKLISKITPFIFKRSKEQVLKDLPGKTTTTVTIALTETQQDIYSTYLRKTRLMLKNSVLSNKFRMLQAILRLRQICVDPSAFLLNYSETPAKIAFALDMIDEVLKAGSKMIIYSSFTTVLDSMKKKLKALGIAYYMITGRTSAHDRITLSTKFNNNESEVKIMLVSIKAGGIGLNLIGADTILILDPWWNAAVEEQAADRSYRIGQTKPVSVYKLIAHNTIEEKIIRLQDKKKALYDKLISEDTSNIEGLTEEDIEYIFS